jgi:hypothetical protein
MCKVLSLMVAMSEYFKYIVLINYQNDVGLFET